MTAISSITRPFFVGRGMLSIVTALVMVTTLFSRSVLLAETENVPTTPSSLVAAIAAATGGAVASSPGQAATITATSLAATSRALGNSSPATLAVAKQTITSVVEKLSEMNLKSEIASVVRTAVAVTPWLRAEITRAALDASPDLRNEILNAAELGSRGGGKQGQDLVPSISDEINSIIDQVNAQALTANPSGINEGSPTPTPSPTANLSSTAGSSSTETPMPPWPTPNPTSTPKPTPVSQHY